MTREKIFSRKLLSSVVSSAILLTVSSCAHDGNKADDKSSGEKQVTFIHSNDFHGDFHPHVNGRGDNAGVLEGGIARAATLVKNIRQKHSDAIHVHAGDTIHGSATVTLTMGRTMVQAMDMLGVDVATPGNWEFSYGVYRYLQFFGSEGDIGEITDNSKMAIKIDPNEDGLIPTFKTPFREVTYADGRRATNRWGMVAANVYYNGDALDNGINSKGAGKLMTPPYRIVERNGVKIGFIGCTTNRGPQVISTNITTGISFSNCKGDISFPQNKPIPWDKVDADTVASTMGVEKNPTLPTPEGGDKGHVVKGEIAKWTQHLRNVEKVDLVAVISEAGIAENIFAAENVGQGDPNWNGPDIYFSSDMHEETNHAVVVTDPSGKKVIITENSEDIAQIGELTVSVKNGRIAEWKYTAHDIVPEIAEDAEMADLVAQIDQDVTAMIAAGKAVIPYNNYVVKQPLNTVVGSTDMTIERNRFSNEYNPASKINPGVIEGTGHALITDAFRVITNAQVGAIRGFRYTNTVLPGNNITVDDLFHYLPIGAMVALTDVPTSPSSELPSADLEALLVDADKDGFMDGDKDKDGRVLEDNAENKRHFMSFPQSMLEEIERSGNSTMNPLVPNWDGGWLFNYSGLKFDFKPTGKNFNKYGKADSARVSAAKLTGGDNDPSNDVELNTGKGATVSYASYYYDDDPNRVNRNPIVNQVQLGKYNTENPDAKKTLREFVGDKILVVAKDTDGDFVMLNPQAFSLGKKAGTVQPVDAVEVVARYISGTDIPVYAWDAAAGKKGAVHHTAKGLGGKVQVANFEYPRINLVDDSGKPANTLVDCTVEFGSPCIEPFRGAEAAVANGNVPLPKGYIKGVADRPANEGKFEPPAKVSKMESSAY